MYSELVQIDVGHPRYSGYESIWTKRPQLHQQRSLDRALAGREAKVEGDPVVREPRQERQAHQPPLRDLG